MEEENKTMRVAVALVFLLLAACASPAPSCHVGPLSVMNAGQWTPTAADLSR